MKQVDAVHSNVLFLKSVEKRLRDSHVVSARAEAEQMIRHYSGINRMDIFTGQKTVSPLARKSIETALKQRIKGKPLSYVLKEAEFFGLRFFVSPDTLIPRPETEILVEEALQILKTHFSKNSRPDILDIGTGSGCIAVSLTIHRPECRMTALDISSKALKIARKNINYHKLGKKVRILKSDLFSAFKTRKKACWDLIVSNPPYVPVEDLGGLSKEVLSEPRIALSGGDKGFSVIDRILDQAHTFLKDRGWLLFEIGDGQAGILAEKILKEKKLINLRFAKDLNGIDRVLIAQKWTN